MLGSLAGLLGGDPDALLAALGRAATVQLRPFFAEARERLLDHVTNEPPSTWSAALEREGLRLPADAQLRLWRAVFRALAAQPADADETADAS